MATETPTVYTNVTTRICSDFRIVLVINLAQIWEVNNQGSSLFLPVQVYQPLQNEQTIDVNPPLLYVITYNITYYTHNKYFKSHHKITSILPKNPALSKGVNFCHAPNLYFFTEIYKPSVHFSSGFWN